MGDVSPTALGEGFLRKHPGGQSIKAKKQRPLARCRAHISSHMSKPDEPHTTITNSHHPTISHQDKDTAHASMLVGERVGGLLKPAKSLVRIPVWIRSPVWDSLACVLPWTHRRARRYFLEPLRCDSHAWPLATRVDLINLYKYSMHTSKCPPKS